MKSPNYSATIILPCLLLCLTSTALAHCEIPCGIYNDQLRFAMMREDIETIRKSVAEITELSGQTPPNYNQLVRWVDNKETHADKLSDVVTQYFLKQRVKPPEEGDAAGREKYLAQIEVLHGILIYAMKCKQSLDTANIDKLAKLVDKFEDLYLGENKEHRH